MKNIMILIMILLIGLLYAQIPGLQEWVCDVNEPLTDVNGWTNQLWRFKGENRNIAIPSPYFATSDTLRLLDPSDE